MRVGEHLPDDQAETVLAAQVEEWILAQREEPWCGAFMPRAKTPCIGRRGHAGAHRSA